jgi:hypothetical protein
MINNSTNINKQTITSRLKSLNIQVLTLLEQAHKLGGIKPVVNVLNVNK